MSTQQPVRIGARGSKLSLAQAGQMQRRIAVALGADPADAERVAPLVVITTTGDRVQDRRLLEIGGKGLFTKEIEEALLDGRIDCAIHSLKDVATESPPGLVIAATPEREDPRDAFLSHKAETFAQLPAGAVLGTASLRRAAQALNRRPDLKIAPMRGNVDTRLAKLAAGEADAILLALSGLKRLGLGHLPQSLIDPVEAPPAPGQGALALQVREGDERLVEAVDDAETRRRVVAERACVARIGGGCLAPVAAHHDGATLTALVADEDGRWLERRSGDDAEAVAAALAPFLP